jgi:hypothetical protein
MAGRSFALLAWYRRVFQIRILSRVHIAYVVMLACYDYLDTVDSELCILSTTTSLHDVAIKPTKKSCVSMLPLNPAHRWHH